MYSNTPKICFDDDRYVHIHLSCNLKRDHPRFSKWQASPAVLERGCQVRARSGRIRTFKRHDRGEGADATRLFTKKNCNRLRKARPGARALPPLSGRKSGGMPSDSLGFFRPAQLWAAVSLRLLLPCRRGGRLRHRRRRGLRPHLRGGERRPVVLGGQQQRPAGHREHGAHSQPAGRGSGYRCEARLSPALDVKVVWVARRQNGDSERLGERLSETRREIRRGSRDSERDSPRLGKRLSETRREAR